MPKKIKTISQEKNLIKRYLLWCYKMTKESLDKIDRKFTQLKVDEYILGELINSQKIKSSRTSSADKTQMNDFIQYIERKRKLAAQEKFIDPPSGKLKPDYAYLQDRLVAIEKAIRYFLGSQEVNHIRKLYEQEMIQRILTAREHV